MKNKIKIVNITTQYSLIEVYKNDTVSKHMVSNNGDAPLSYWIAYYEKRDSIKV